MTGITQIEKDARIDEIIQEAQCELSTLRDELGRSRVVFDSARLIVGHELIKPLTSIKGYIELITEEKGEGLSERHRRYIDKVMDSIVRMEELIGSIVTMLRVDSSFERANDLERIDIARVVRKVIGNFGGEGSRVQVRIDRETPPVVLSRLCFEVVLENILSNALKHGGSAAPVVVSTEIRKDRRAGGKNELLMVSVEDRGSGMPEDKLDEIFNPFCRLNEESEVPGLGLGLALVRSIVTIMNGEIHVKSNPGKGTRITFTVPLASEANNQPEFVG